MATEIVINAHPFETRVAILENRVVTEIAIERAKDRGISGNIYKGRVSRVLPGMQAAFIDIGQEKAAFLHVSDIVSDASEFDDLFSREEGGGGAGAEEEDEEPSSAVPAGGRSIDELLREGQEIVVQVTKESIGTKGPRVTAYLALPGRFLVLVPTLNKIGVSRRIQDPAERDRLKTILKQVAPDGAGFIVRTAAEGVPDDVLRRDMEFLARIWDTIVKKKKSGRAPSLIYEELDLPFRILRDLFSGDVTAIHVDSGEEHRKIVEFSRKFMPRVREVVRMHEEETPIFESFGVELEINRALGRKIWLKSGGYLVIDQTEALTSIDVNTGRFVGKRNLEETIVRTNLEAVGEIVYQLKLRNIGGLIILDFIDMETPSGRRKVFSALEEALRQDRAKTTILQISELGLVEMTRKRVRESLSRTMTEACPYCEGRGTVKSLRTVAYEVFRQVLKESPGLEGKKVVVVVHPKVADLLYGEEREFLDALEKRVEKKLVVKTDYNLHQEEYQILGL